MELKLKIDNNILVIPNVEINDNPVNGSLSFILQSSKVKKLASVDIEKLNSIKEFISKVLDEERLEQGITKLKEANIPVDEKATGDYIRWVVGDVNKECQDEMAQFDISDKNLGKVISSDARKWFFQRIQQQ